MDTMEQFKNRQYTSKIWEQQKKEMREKQLKKGVRVFWWGRIECNNNIKYKKV